MRILLDECLPKLEVFLTVDRNLSVQQDVSQFKIAVIVLVAKGNRHSDLQPLVPDLLAVLGSVLPGQVLTVGKGF